MKKAIATEKAPGAIGPYAQAQKFGNIIHTSGQLPINPETKEMPATIEEQTEQALNNAKAILESEGYEMSDIVKTLVLLDDIEEFSRMNEVYAKFFSAPFPARSAFEVAKLPLGAKVEIEVIAYKE